MSVKAKLEAIIYATEEPVTANQLSALLKDAVIDELRAEEQARLTLNELVAEPQPPEDDLDEEYVEFEEPKDIPAEDENLSPSGAAVSEPAQAPLDPKAQDKEDLRRVKDRIDLLLEELIAEYASPDRGMEIRQIAGGYRMATKPEHHDVVVNFVKSLKPPTRLSMQALETLSVIAYKQPVTVPEVSEIRGVDSAGVIATLLDRKLITTGGRKQVIGRPILYKTTKEFLLRFGLNDVNELPSMEEFEKLGDPQSELFQAPVEMQPRAASDAREESAPVTEADPELVKAENSNEGSSATSPPPADLNEPERFNEAIAPVAGVDEPGDSSR
jgi:segregation and condensation protein B